MTARTDTSTSLAITLDDFVTGLIAGLAADGVEVVAFGGQEFYAAVEAAFQELERRSNRDSSLRLKFWITRNRIYGDSADVREAITRAVQRDLVSLDNPRYVNMRLRVDQSEASGYLDSLPGGSQLYRDLTQIFRDNYESEVSGLATAP